jgi:hypothetical protein
MICTNDAEQCVQNGHGSTSRNKKYYHAVPKDDIDRATEDALHVLHELQCGYNRGKRKKHMHALLCAVMDNI